MRPASACTRRASRRAVGPDVVQAQDRQVSIDAPPRAQAALRFAVGGKRTVLLHQRVPYPFHVTRVFHLDPARPDLATLYLQSASGGLYRGDRLGLAIDVAPAAAVHVTTQAATIVHDTRGVGAAQLTEINVADNGFAAVTPDPLVLFPGAAITSTTEIVLAPSAGAILTDGVACHDLDGTGRAFDRYAVAVIVRDEHRRLLVADRGSLNGTEFLGEASPLGRYRAVGAVFVLGRGAERLDPAALERRLDGLGCLAGIGAMPNGAGLGGRILAPDGGTLARGLDAAFAHAFEAMVGIPPAPRRK
jgi:urease accessory protein